MALIDEQCHYPKKKLPVKLKDLRSFPIPCAIEYVNFEQFYMT